MSESERPSHGGRIQVRLLSADDQGARYSVEVADGGGSWLADAAIDAAGRVSFSEFRGPAAVPAWLEQATRALLRSAWQRREAGNTWPRRLARWRPAPAGTD